MKGYIQNIEKVALENENFRMVLYTAQHSQLVVMNIPVGRDIGEEVHTLDQFFRVEQGEGVAILDGVETAISDGFAVLVPAGARHNIVNSGSVALKLYSVYAPPNHHDGVIHETKENAEGDEEHFDGKTSE